MESWSNFTLGDCSSFQLELTPYIIKGSVRLPGYLTERQKEGKEQNWRFNKNSGYFFVVTDTIWPSLDVFGCPQIGSDTSRFSSWIPPVSHQLNERGALPTSFSNKRNITSSSCNSSSSSCKICSSSSSSDNLNERGALATRWQTVFHKSRPREGKLCGFASSCSIVVIAVAESRRVGLGRASYIASSSIYSICSSCSNIGQQQL